MQCKLGKLCNQMVFLQSDQPACRLVFLWKTVHTIPGDTMIESIWKQNTEMPRFPAMQGDIRVEVLIVGGGLAGLLCAYELDRAGIEYVLIEADRICGGVTGNTTAKITSQHGLIYGKLLRKFGPETARGYWRANEEALARYRDLAQEIDCDFRQADNYVYSCSSRKKLEAELDALRQARIPASFAEPGELPFPTVGAIRFADQAQFDPLKFAAGIARGLNIYEQTAAKEFQGNVVLTDRGRITASKIIIATHFPILNKHGGYFLKMYQDRSYVLALENAGRMEGMYRDEADKGLSFRSHGDLLLLGGGGHRTGKQGGGWAELEACVRKWFPQARIRSRWAAQDCMSLDGIPYIGRYSHRTPELFAATGFNKWGMTSSMVCAMILGDLVRGRENPYASIFSPQRTMLRLQLAANAASSAWNLLTPTVPRCPHLGCALKWNAQEHSWDCPCHGSRFAEDGSLLDNPSTGDMKRTK